MVVDDCSVPPVLEGLPTCKLGGTLKCRLRVIRNSQRRQQPASRMEGVRASTEQFVFFGEDDAALAAGHVQALLCALQESYADGVASYWLQTTSLDPDPNIVRRLPSSSSKHDFVNLRDVNLQTAHAIASPLRVPWLHTLALIRKDVILKYEFDPNYKGNAFREETDFYLRASHEGAKFMLVDAPPAFHYKGP